MDGRSRGESFLPFRRSFGAGKMSRGGSFLPYRRSFGTGGRRRGRPWGRDEGQPLLVDVLWLSSEGLVFRVHPSSVPTWDWTG